MLVLLVEKFHLTGEVAGVCNLELDVWIPRIFVRISDSMYLDTSSV